MIHVLTNHIVESMVLRQLASRHHFAEQDVGRQPDDDVIEFAVRGGTGRRYVADKHAVAVVAVGVWVERLNIR